MRWERGGYFISDDQALADYDFIQRSINSTYWGKTRSFEKMRTCCRNVTLLSLFEGQSQIGLTRIISDGACVSMLCDVYVDPERRGRGLGVWLVECALDHPASQTDRVLLLTSDAHGLYARFGFLSIEGKLMGMTRG